MESMTFFESTQPRIQPYVKLNQRSPESVISSNLLLSNMAVNPNRNKHVFQNLVINKKSKRELIVYSSVDPGPPAPPAGSLFIALSWVLAITIATVVPLVNYKWRVPKLQNKIEAASKRIEDMAEAVREVAEVVEKVTEDVAEDLPQGGKLRKAADFVEKLAERAAKDAGAIDDFIDKVEEEEKRTEAFVESLKSVEFEKYRLKEKSTMDQPITSDELKNASQDLDDKSPNDL